MATPVSEQQAQGLAFPMLDRLEQLSWEWWLTANAEGEQAASRKHPAPVGVIDVVRILVMEMCQGDSVLAIRTLKAWTEAKWSKLTLEDLKQGRRLNIAQLTRSVMFLGIGNLCGINKPGDADFDQWLAEEGVRRGWREPFAPYGEDAPRTGRRLVALSAPPPLPKPLEEMTKEEVREHMRGWAEEIVALVKEQSEGGHPEGS